MDLAPELPLEKKELDKFKKQSIFEIAPLDMIEELNKELNEDPKFDYESVIHKP